MAPFMAAAKLVDELIEPRMLARGEQMNWYVSGQAAAMADVVFGRGPRLGTVYSELLSAFVAMLRRYRSVTRDAYESLLFGAHGLRQPTLSSTRSWV